MSVYKYKLSRGGVTIPLVKPFVLNTIDMGSVDESLDTITQRVGSLYATSNVAVRKGKLQITVFPDSTNSLEYNKNSIMTLLSPFEEVTYEVYSDIAGVETELYTLPLRITKSTWSYKWYESSYKVAVVNFQFTALDPLFSAYPYIQNTEETAIYRPSSISFLPVSICQTLEDDTCSVSKKFWNKGQEDMDYQLDIDITPSKLYSIKVERSHGADITSVSYYFGTNTTVYDIYYEKENNLYYICKNIEGSESYMWEVIEVTDMASMPAASSITAGKYYHCTRSYSTWVEGYYYCKDNGVGTSPRYQWISKTKTDVEVLPEPGVGGIDNVENIKFSSVRYTLDINNLDSDRYMDAFNAQEVRIPIGADFDTTNTVVRVYLYTDEAQTEYVDASEGCTVYTTCKFVDVV